MTGPREFPAEELPPQSLLAPVDPDEPNAFGPRVREVLAGLDPRVLLDGAREWHRRRPIDIGRPR